MITVRAACSAFLCLALFACSGSGKRGVEDPSSGSEQEERRVSLPGSRVSLWMPERMYRPTRAILFRMDSPMVVVAMTEFSSVDEAGVDAVLRGLRAGLDAGNVEEAQRVDATGFLARGPAEREGLSVQVLGLKAGTAAAAVVVTYEDEAEAVAEQIIDSVVLDREARFDPLSMSGITVSDRAGFEVWPTLSHPVVFAEQGATPPLEPEAPSLALVTIDYPKPQMTDRELGQLLGQLIADLEPVLSEAETQPFELDGRPAVEVVVPGKRDEVPVTVYGFIARGTDSAFGGFGHVGPAMAADVLPRFKRPVRSIALDDGVFQAR